LGSRAVSPDFENFLKALVGNRVDHFHGSGARRRLRHAVFMMKLLFDNFTVNEMKA
jgi:hypothetical protein